MTALIYIISALIITSKFLDCYTTTSQITSISQERNPIARKIMKTLGIHTTIWAIFVLSIVIVGISIWLLFSFYNTTFYKILYIAFGLLITLAHCAVAHTNKTKRLNVFTRFLLTKMYRRGS